MEEDTYPDLEEMCRLCLRITDKADLVDIFAPTKESTVNGNSSVQLYIPMRIMTCSALEVQSGDGLPKQICCECRYQLEKSYYFRKRNQQSDLKLRKHIRMLNLGKKSRVFARTEDDEYEDELEFEDSIQFIEKWEKKKKEEENVLWEQKLQTELDIKISLAKNEWIEQYKADIKDEVAKELRNAVVAEVKAELRGEIEQKVRTALRDECFEQAKLEVRSEVVEECRERERFLLLDELQAFLNQKRDDSAASNESSKKLDEAQTNVQSTLYEQIHNVPKPELTIDNDEECAQTEADMDDEEDGSEFYLIEPINSHEDEGSIALTKPASKCQKTDESQRFEYFEDKMGDGNFRLAASESHSHEQGAESYHIADSGEVQYYRKGSKNENAEEQQIRNNNEHEEDNVIVLNFDDDMETEQVGSEDFSESKKLYVMKTSEPDNFAKDENKIPVSKLFTKKIVADSIDFPVHLRKTDTPKTFKCDSCPMVFSTSNALDRHLRTHAKGEQRGVSFQCSICMIYVSCKSALKRHMIIHTGKKPNVCEECGKSFVQREVLKRHMLTHTGARPHVCTHCRRTFTQKNNLINHINRAHSEVPIGQQYSCHLCPKRFSHTSGLSRHLVTHTGLTFQCSACKRKFADRSSVKRHITNIHGVGKDETIENVKIPVAELYTAEDEDVIEASEENDAEFLVS